MKNIKLLSILFLTIIVNTAFAQLKRANKYYDHFDYANAIELYEKVLKKNDNAEAIEKLANSYRLTKNYKLAEINYARLIKFPNINPLNYFYYGQVLKNNNKIDEAKEQFKKYASISPGDKKAEISIQSCDDVKLWLSKTKQFEVKEVLNINSEYADFCPLFFKNQLVFISERTKDLVNYSNNSWNKQSFLNVYTSGVTTDKDGNMVFSEKVKSFPWPINKNFHDGPVCFNAEQNTMYLTRADYFNKKDKQFINRPKLYISTLKGKKWSKAKPFQYNADSYSIAHPSISADGQWLFFASDMPGGKGGMDIYVCKKEGDAWGNPQNLEEINTIGNEEFPFIRKDGVLYFSSDGHSGFGGLDIFSATKKENKFSDVKNLGAPLNSFTDDFGIVFLDDNKKGYFSSDREKGKGADDIYSFTALSKFISISGKILLSKNVNNPAKNATVLLLTEDGMVIKVSSTDSTGFFEFNNLDPDKKYLVKLDETDPDLTGKKRYYLTDDQEKIIRVTVVNDKGGKFVFQNLPADPNSLTQLDVEDDITIAGNLLYGENPSKPMENTKINLVNDKGEIIQSVTTNAFGAFVFADLPSDESFMVKIDEGDSKLAPNTKIIITNKSGKEIQTTKANATGVFKFQFLGSDQKTLEMMSVEDNELRFDWKGKLLAEDKSPLANTTINLIRENGEVIQTTKTDNKGNFKLYNLPANKDLLFALDENDVNLKPYNKIYLTDGNGTIIKEFKRFNNKLRFKLLSYEQSTLGVVYVDDPWLKVLQLKNDAKKDSLTIVENVYYNYGEYKILPEAQKTLDKVINLMKNDSRLIIELYSHTDSRSTKEYNMKLSQQRAKAAVDYIVAKGISTNRISGKGYGESKLINKCADGIACSEEEHAKNRRTEFKILYKQK